MRTNIAHIRQSASLHARCYSYGDCNAQCRYIKRNCNCNYDDKRQSAKCPSIKRSTHKRKDDHCNNQPKKAGYKKPRSNGKVRGPIHSFPDKPARHTWAECLENLANQKKPASQSTVDAHHTLINNCYLSNDDGSAMDSDCTKAANNKDRSINRRLFSNFDDNFATFLAPPLSVCTKAAEKNVERSDKPAKKKRKTIAASSSNSNEKHMAYAQSTLSSAKGLKEPLV
jgi:hypothetical protein